MNETIDNQQETIENICWLAGAFDADGTVTIRDTTNRTPSPYMDVSNSDDYFINKVVKVIQSLGINPYISEQKLNKKWKKVYRVRVHKRLEVKKLLEVLLPYLTAKQARASLVINYINNRITNDNKKEDRIIIDKVKSLNRRGDIGSSETICGKQHNAKI